MRLLVLSRMSAKCSPAVAKAFLHQLGCYPGTPVTLRDIHMTQPSHRGIADIGVGRDAGDTNQSGIVAGDEEAFAGAIKSDAHLPFLLEPSEVVVALKSGRLGQNRHARGKHRLKPSQG